MSGNPRRIGLFGGSFDPVHNAHVALAGTALAELALDELRWIPTGQPWHKTRQVSDGVHREAMVRLAMGDEPRYRLERRELQRAGPSYTLDTVRELQASESGNIVWFLIIGADQYAALPGWNQWHELLDRVKLAVANRPGPARPVDPAVQAHAHTVVPLPMMDISSTDVRARVAAGLSIEHLVPPQVARYIETHALYRGNTGS